MVSFKKGVHGGLFILTMLDFEVILHWADICQLQFTLTGAKVVTTSYRIAGISLGPSWLRDGILGGGVCVWGSFRLIASTICLKRGRGVRLS